MLLAKLRFKYTYFLYIFLYNIYKKNFIYSHFYVHKHCSWLYNYLLDSFEFQIPANWVNWLCESRPGFRLWRGRFGFSFRVQVSFLSQVSRISLYSLHIFFPTFFCVSLLARSSSALATVALLFAHQYILLGAFGVSGSSVSWLMQNRFHIVAYSVYRWNQWTVTQPSWVESSWGLSARHTASRICCI